MDALETFINNHVVACKELQDCENFSFVGMITNWRALIWMDEDHEDPNYHEGEWDSDDDEDEDEDVGVEPHNRKTCLSCHICRFDFGDDAMFQFCIYINVKCPNATIEDKCRLAGEYEKDGFPEYSYTMITQNTVLVYE